MAIYVNKEGVASESLHLHGTETADDSGDQKRVRNGRSWGDWVKVPLMGAIFWARNVFAALILCLLVGFACFLIYGFIEANIFAVEYYGWWTLLVSVPLTLGCLFGWGMGRVRKPNPHVIGAAAGTTAYSDGGGASQG